MTLSIEISNLEDLQILWQNGDRMDLSLQKMEGSTSAFLNLNELF